MNGSMVVENLSVVSSGRTRIDSISFSAPPASWLSIVGENGAGKSTLLKALAGIVPAHGTIRCGDVRVESLRQRERARCFAYVPQRYEPPIGFLVEQFLRLAGYAGGINDSAILEETCDLFRLSEYRQRSIRELSVGELQRVMLAASFAQGSQVLLLDEPLSALDPIQESQTLALLRMLQRERDRTIIFVSHNLSAALTFADSVLALSDTRQFFHGSVADCLDQKVPQRLFRQPFSLQQDDFQIHVLPQYGGSGD